MLARAPAPPPPHTPSHRHPQCLQHHSIRGGPQRVAQRAQQLGAVVQQQAGVAPQQRVHLYETGGSGGGSNQRGTGLAALPQRLARGCAQSAQRHGKQAVAVGGAGASHPLQGLELCNLLIPLQQLAHGC